MNWFQKLRRYIIIKTAENYYQRMYNRCNTLYKNTKQHHYIIIDPWLGDKITITNRANFRAVKRAINASGMRLAARNNSMPMLTDATMPDVHSGCFYSTLLQSQLDTLMRKPAENANNIRKVENDIEARRRAYIKWTLEHAKIRHRKTREERKGARMVRRQLKEIRRKQGRQ